jgi:hypothetical protein
MVLAHLHVVDSIRRRLARRGVRGDLLADLSAEALRRFLEACQRGEPWEGDPEGIARALADRVLVDHVRALRPNWNRLRRRILYLIDSRGSTFARWKDSESHLAGLRAWNGRSRKITSEFFELCEDRDAFLKFVEAGARHVELPLEDLMERFFRWIGTPVGVSELTSHLARATGVDETIVVSLEPLIERDWAAPDSHARGVEDGIVDRLEAERSCRELWSEICRLPLKQRIALLFVLDPAELLLLAPSLEAIAQALEREILELSSVWGRLPLADSELADMMAIERVQVSNLRKAARQRLLRAMARFSTAEE